MSRIAARLVVRGRVQGVGYRWWARGEARRLGLAGWVRNRMDGSVELLAIGPADAVRALEESCRRGPLDAQVASIDRLDADDEGLTEFDQRPTV